MLCGRTGLGAGIEIQLINHSQLELVPKALGTATKVKIELQLHYKCSDKSQSLTQLRTGVGTDGTVHLR